MIRDLPREQCPENKVAIELASPRSLASEPILVGVDECQVWFKYEHKTTRDKFIAIRTDLVKHGPTLGIRPGLGCAPVSQSAPRSDG